MSGSRQDWLDDETAARLLRGEPVGVADTGDDRPVPDAAQQQHDLPLALARLLGAASGVENTLGTEGVPGVFGVPGAAGFPGASGVRGGSGGSGWSPSGAGRPGGAGRPVVAPGAEAVGSRAPGVARAAGMTGVIGAIDPAREEKALTAFREARSGEAMARAFGLTPDPARSRVSRLRDWSGSVRATVTAVAAATALTGGVVTATMVGSIPTPFTGPAAPPVPHVSGPRHPVAGSTEPPQMTEPAGSSSSTPTSIAGSGRSGASPVTTHRAGGARGTDDTATGPAGSATLGRNHPHDVDTLCQQYLAAENAHGPTAGNSGPRYDRLKTLADRSGEGRSVDSFCRLRLDRLIPGHPWAPASPPATGEILGTPPPAPAPAPAPSTTATTCCPAAATPSPAPSATTPPTPSVVPAPTGGCGDAAAGAAGGTGAGAAGGAVAGASAAAVGTGVGTGVGADVGSTGSPGGGAAKGGAAGPESAPKGSCGADPAGPTPTGPRVAPAPEGSPAPDPRTQVPYADHVAHPATTPSATPSGGL